MEIPLTTADTTAMTIDFDLHDPYGVSAYRVSATLREQGCSVLAPTDVQASLKEKR